MRNRYYQLSKKEQRIFYVRLIAVSLFALLCIARVLLFINPKALILVVFFIPLILSIIAPFFDIPGLVKQGKLTYHSLFLLAEQEKAQVIKIHSASLFDYYFVFEKDMSKQTRTQLVLLESLKGLRDLALQTDDPIKIQGTSYIINERTANKVGLQKVPTNEIQRLILAFNYIPLLISLSLVKKSLVFPNLNQVKTFEGNVSTIKERLPFINHLIEKLENNRQSA